MSMPEEKPATRVSLCIPSWRGNTLARFLESVRAQKHPLDYELHIRDDHSPHGVREAFDANHRGEPNWFYRRNDQNLGGYDNIRACTDDARGEFVLIISDDDVLAPDAFETLDRTMTLANQARSQAIFVCDRLNPAYGRGAVMPNSFAWLRDVSMNVPAFISRVVWRRRFWEGYDYHGYPPEMSLPQLDCFLDACLAGPIVAANRDFVTIGKADDTAAPTYWFFSRHAPVDAYEYPNLYRKVLSKGRPDLRTRLMIRARRLSLLRQIYQKILFMRYHEDFYHAGPATFWRYHKGTFYSLWFMPLVWLLLDTPAGRILATRRYAGSSKLPARPAGTPGYDYDRSSMPAAGR